MLKTQCAVARSLVLLNPQSLLRSSYRVTQKHRSKSRPTTEDTEIFA